MTSTPSLVIRLPASRSRRARTSSRNDGEWRTSKRSCTAVLSLLTFCPPGPEARMNRSCSSCSSMLIVSVMRIMRASYTEEVRRAGLLPFRQIPLREHLAFFDGGLVERIDAEQMRGNDRFQHEVHQQFPEAALVEPIEMDSAHRAAVLRQRLGGGAALRGDEIAHGFAGEIRLARKLREIGGEGGRPAGGARGYAGGQAVPPPPLCGAPAGL